MKAFVCGGFDSKYSVMVHSLVDGDVYLIEDVSYGKAVKCAENANYVLDLAQKSLQEIKSLKEA